MVVRQWFGVRRHPIPSPVVLHRVDHARRYERGPHGECRGGQLDHSRTEPGTGSIRDGGESVERLARSREGCLADAAVAAASHRHLAPETARPLRIVDAHMDRYLRHVVRIGRMDSDHRNRAVGHEDGRRCHWPRPTLSLEMPRHPDRQHARLRRLHVVDPAGGEEETRGRGRGADAIEGIKRFVEVESVVCGRHEQDRTADQRRVKLRGLRMPGEGVSVERVGIADHQPFRCFPVTVDAGGIAIERDDRLQTGIGSGHHPTEITAGRDSIGADPLPVDARVLGEEGHGPAPRRRRAVPEIPAGIRHIPRPRRSSFALTENGRAKIGEASPPRQRPLVIETDTDVAPLRPECHRLQAR